MASTDVRGVQIAGRKNLRFYSPGGALDMSIFTEYISVEVYDQTPRKVPDIWRYCMGQAIPNKKKKLFIDRS